MKRLAALLLTAALALAFAAAGAECLLPEYAEKMVDPENPAAYVIRSVDYDEMSPAPEYSPLALVELIRTAEIVPAEQSEKPDGEYIVLAFPDDKIEFYFYLGDTEKSWFSQINPDGSEELYRAEFPDDVFVTLGMTAEAEADALAEALGMIPEIWAVLPEDGWVLDTIEDKVFWQSDRATLEDICVEDTDNFKVQILWSSSAWETTEWVFAGSYEAETKSIHAEHLVIDNLVFDDNGEETDRTNIYDGDSSAVFALNEDGRVVIRDAGSSTLEGMVFERFDVPPEGEPAAE